MKSFVNKEELFVYWGPASFLDDLREEIARGPEMTLLDLSESRMMVTGQYRPMAWAEAVWRNCHLQNFSSIREASLFLKQKAPLWSARSVRFHRRAELIRSQLASPRPKIRTFAREALPDRPLGGFTLLSETELLWSDDIWPSIPGELKFGETREPPSRAYLKLWDLMTLTGVFPEPRSKCLEIGASPGGWTWVLRKLGCLVWAVDRSELVPALMNDSGVQFKKGDAFSLRPGQVPAIDWIFSDVICYPKRLFDWLQPWLAANPSLKCVCTLKFQGSTDYDTMDLFRSIPGSFLLHLPHNKHEVTWCRFPIPERASRFLLP